MLKTFIAYEQSHNRLLTKKQIEFCRRILEERLRIFDIYISPKKMIQKTISTLERKI